MPTKAEMYAQMADHVATQLTGSWQEWTAFLTTAARLYKYPFHEQMMIYAQRPDATACAEYDLWNEKMGRYVRRGSKGIALVDDSGDRPRLRYVFDITDTGTREHSRTPWLWKLEERHMDSVTAMLERNYGIAGNDLPQQLTDVAGKLAGEYWEEHQQDFRYIVDGSFLEDYDELNIEVQFKAAATVSIAYALMSRCGLEPEQYFSHEDFMAIFDFNCFLASNFPHFHRYDSLKSALYIHAVSKNINTFPKNQGRIRAAIAVKILDFTVMYR